MSVSILELSAGAPAARFVEAHRSDIVTNALTRTLPPDQWTLLAEVLVENTIDQLIGWLQQPVAARIFIWIQEALREQDVNPGLFQLFPTTVSAALDALARDTELNADVAAKLSALHRDIDIHVGGHRTALYGGALRAVDAVDAKIEQLLFRLSQRDAVTAEHSRSVSMWCFRIARHLKLDRADVLRATRGGLLHDIGKIRTPVNILSAPRALDESEWEIMKAHTLDGVRLVEGIRELRPFVPAIRWHHERYDGKGYPDQRCAAEIPFVARIVSVADAFNAMIARRPYRSPVSPAAALEELKRHSGSQFDANVVAAMIKVALGQSR